MNFYSYQPVEPLLPLVNQVRQADPMGSQSIFMYKLQMLVS